MNMKLLISISISFTIFITTQSSKIIKPSKSADIFFLRKTNSFTNQKFHLSHYQILSLPVIIAPQYSLATAQEAVDILHGQQIHSPETLTWSVLIIGAYLLQYKIFRILSNF
jgi:hypothetical protein